MEILVTSALMSFRAGPLCHSWSDWLPAAAVLARVDNVTNVICDRTESKHQFKDIHIPAETPKSQTLSSFTNPFVIPNL